MFKKITHRIKQACAVFNGYFNKFRIDIWGLSHLKPLQTFADRKSKIVVSLTSYGRRVSKNVVYYTIVSLLEQSLRPDRIILWLDYTNWNEDNLPPKLKRLKALGVEIYFCKDVRSYTKLVYALTLCKNDCIITVDDDAIYRKDLVKDLYEAHRENPDAIICNMARFPELQEDGHMRPYETWFAENPVPRFVMPLGVSGVLYPPHSLHPDVTREDLYMKLCPSADDIWFWTMGIINQAKYVVINQNLNIVSSFDWLYQILHTDSALTSQNRVAGKNDTQIRAVQEYYNLQFRDYASNSHIITSTLSHKK